MNATQLRHAILRHIRNAFALGWTTRLALAAREFAALLRARLLLLRVAG